MNLPYMHAPCSNCPFTVDCRREWLGEARIKNILSQNSFVCHKTAQGKKKDRLQCAGHMILKGDKNQFVDLANRFGIPLTLKGKDRVFQSEQECIEHHKFE